MRRRNLNSRYKNTSFNSTCVCLPNLCSVMNKNLASKPWIELEVLTTRQLHSFLNSTFSSIYELAWEWTRLGTCKKILFLYFRAYCCYVVKGLKHIVEIFPIEEILLPHSWCSLAHIESRLHCVRFVVDVSALEQFHLRAVWIFSGNHYFAFPPYRNMWKKCTPKFSLKLSVTDIFLNISD